MTAGNDFKGFMRRSTGLGVLAAAVLVCGLSLKGAPPDRGSQGEAGSAALLKTGHPVPVEQIPSGPTVRARRPDVLLRERGDVFLRSNVGDAGDVVTATGGPTSCELDIECDDCNPCTLDKCIITGGVGACVPEPVAECDPCDDETFCDGTDKCDATGVCQDVSLIAEFQCISGTNAGKVCFNELDTQQVCSPDVGDPGDICQLVKVNTDPCRFFPDLLCDALEPVGVGDFGACVTTCDTDADCDDAIACNGAETCVKDSSTVGNGGVCVGPGTPGAACATAGDCGAGDICAGVCRDAPDRPCGRNWGSSTVACEAATGLTCGPGRCCMPNGNDWTCSRATKADCEGGGGMFLGVGDVASTPVDDADLGGGVCLPEADESFPTPGETFLCPKYSAGVITGNIVGIIGRAGASTCNPYWEIGDDYNLSNCKIGAPSWYKLLTMRWVGGHVKGRGSRMRVSFYDADGQFVADRITGGAFPGGITRNTVVFDEKPVVPCAGFMTIKPATSFSPDNQVEWAVTDAFQVGTSDSQLYARKHGYCAGDTACPNRLTSAGCTPCNSDADCSAFSPATCIITSGVNSADDGVALKGGPLVPIAMPQGGAGLAFELAGEKVAEPTGACCQLATGNCDPELPWVCANRGDFFQGPGSSCNICSNDFFRGCDQAADCSVCAGGSRDGLLCECPGGVCDVDICTGGTRDGQDCGCPAPGVCDTTASCLPVPPACQVSACCDTATGSCVEVTGNHCIGGPNDTQPCSGNSDCVPGGSCFFASGTCVGGDRGDQGTCVGGFCTGTAGRTCAIDADCAPLDCIGDLECPGGECVPPCPPGSSSPGFGTKCKPNCCVQAVDSGADTCAEAPIVVINVPALGEPPVTHTWTSNNKAATFGDFVAETAFCAGGQCAGDGATACKSDTDCTGVGGPCEFTVACGVDADCTNAGVNGPCIITGPGTCNSGRFDPDGATRDRGWWHAFSIDDCADIRIDHCCTFEIDGFIHQPAYQTLWLDCNPCTSAIGANIVGVGSFPPEPIGDPTRELSRGGPFCDFDDLWNSYGPLPKGIYYYSTYSGTGGHFGDYQLHVTVGACATAACCLPTSVCVGPGGCPDLPADPGTCVANICVGGANAGQPCTTTHGMGCATNDDCAPVVEDQVCTGNDTNRPNQLCCPGGACDNDPGNPLCVGGTRDGMACCDGGGECKGQCTADCVVDRETECDALGGFWNGFGNIPLADNPTLSCDFGICDAGSCCLGPGDCNDDASANCTPGTDCCGDGSGNQFCIDRKLCAIDNGTFVGGARCEHPKNPCPACEIQGDSNCHLPDGLHFPVMSDLAAAPGGVVYADDVILSGGSVDQICVWGTYMDGQNTVASNDCSGEVVDNFRVRFYGDFPDATGGRPDHLNILGEAVGLTIANGGVAKSDTQLQTPQTDAITVEVFTLTFPSMSLPTGVRIWLEVANNTDTPTGATSPVANTCNWHWLQHSRIASGDPVNGWAYVGTDYRPIGPDPQNPLPGGRPGKTGYLDLGHGYSDLTFCLGNNGAPANFTEPDEVLGSCCNCDRICTDGVSLADCYGEVGADGGSADNNRWKRGAVCPDGCLPLEGVPGDDCGAVAAGSAANVVDCTPPIPQPGSCVVIKDGAFEAQSVCANSSIPQPFGTNDYLGRDFFACYTTTATGKLFISMCNGGMYYNNMDSFLAVYHDFDNPADCPCPNSPTDFNTAQSDEGCNGQADGGAGIVSGMIVLPGECWLARIGGWGDSLSATDRGIARADIGVIASPCTLTQVPALQTQFTVAGAAAGTDEPKNRFIPIKGGGPCVLPDGADCDAFVNQTLRVTWTSMPNWPGGHLALNGRTRWITAPFQVCENSGNGLATTPPNCGPSSGQPQKWFWAARTTDDPTLAWFGDLTKMGDYCTGSGEACDPLAPSCTAGTCGTDGVIHIQHPNIVPSKKNPSQPAVYSVQSAADNCNLSEEASYSDPLVVTNPIWGDAVQSAGTCPNGPPNGVVDVGGDIVAAINKFSNLACAPKKTRVDMEPGVQDFKINFTDVLQALGGFQGKPYPFAADLTRPENGKKRERLHAGR